MSYYTFLVINTVCSMHRAAVWQHNINSNIKIVHNFIEHFLSNPSNFSADNALTCVWIVFTNSVFQVSLQKIVRQVEILGIGWPGVIGLTRNESVPWEVMPEVFKCSVRERRWRLISWTEQNKIVKVVDNFNVRVAAVLSYNSTVHRTNIVLITEKV